MTRKKLVRGLLVLGATLLAADLATSLFLIRDGLFLGRPLPPFGAITHPRQLKTLDAMGAEPQGIGSFDPGLGWDWQPGSRSPEGITIGALGARGPRVYGPRPAPGRRRAVFFGDSFTFCDEIADTGTFQFQLEQLDPRYEALNFGVSGYGTDQALLRYRRMGRQLGAEVVGIGILLENIGRNVNRYRPLWNTRTGFCVTKPRFVLAADGTLELVAQPFASSLELREAILGGTLLARIREHEYWYERPPVPLGGRSAVLRIGAGYLAYRQRSPARLWRDTVGEPFRVTLAILETFQREALADGARLAPILIFPSKEDLREHALPGRPYWEELLAELEARSLAYVDLIEPLARAAREQGEDPPGKSLYYGGHLSRVGNALVARELAAWIGARLE